MDDTPNADDDGELLPGLRAGHDWAFERLVRSTSPHLLAVARRYTRSEEDARDALQTAYLNAFRALPGFEGKSRLSTWLHRIVVNAALMKLRSQQRKPETSIDELLPSFQQDGHHVEQFADWGPSAEQLLEQKRTRETVRRCIERLPDDYRTVLLLRDIEDLSTEETSRVLGVTRGAVKTRLHRARQALSTLLRAQYAAGETTR